GPVGPGGGTFQQNLTVHRIVINTLLCPSDIDRLTNADGHVNYAANDGNLQVFYRRQIGGAWIEPNGLFARSDFIGDSRGTPPVNFRDITDGLSMTAAMSEGQGHRQREQVVRHRLAHGLVLRGRPSNPRQYAGCLPGLQCGGPPQAGSTLFDGAMMQYWHIGYPSTARYNHVMPPNTWSCIVPQFTHNANDGAFAASSRHPGSINVLFADGTVRSVKNTINVNIWWAVGSRNGSEIVSADAL
ncbi:MAG: DUF1559 domain-containing protein, partial [Singulisphaera sp.]